MNQRLGSEFIQNAAGVSCSKKAILASSSATRACTGDDSRDGWVAEWELQSGCLQRDVVSGTNCFDLAGSLKNL